MNWNKATNLTIIFLLMVNIFLGALVYNAGRKYTVTQAQQDAAARFLARNGVSLYATIPTEFRPMPTIRIQPSAYDANHLVPAFFGSTADVELDFSDKPVYSREGERLAVEGNSFIYENENQRPGFVLNRVNAVSACNKFLSKHADVLGDFVIDRVKETEDGYTINCSGKLDKYLITSNTMTFYITGDGISRVEGTYNRPLGASAEAKAIISPDEALYIFVKNMNYVYGDQEILLDSMEIVYFLAEAAGDSTTPLNASPYYRFFVFSGDAQVMINAYTGAVYGSVY